MNKLYRNMYRFGVKARNIYFAQWFTTRKEAEMWKKTLCKRYGWREDDLTVVER